MTEPLVTRPPGSSAELLPDARFIGRLADPAAWDTVATIDYTDPTLGGLVPLVRVTGRERVRLSENLTLGDFAASDGAGYARISPRLVHALEALMAKIERPVSVSSGYRHSALNGKPEVGGAARSLHMAGMAADIWSFGLKPIQLAEAVLDTVGCRVGIGLGRTFIHVDMRGYLASWATDDAPMTDAEFQQWVSYHCSGRDLGAEPDPALRALLERFSDDPEGKHDHAHPQAVAADYADAMAGFARVQARRNLRGAVLLDFRRHNLSPAERQYDYVIGFVTEGSLEAQSLGIGPLLRTSPAGYFVYVLINRDNSTEIGVMNLGERSGSAARGVPAS